MKGYISHSKIASGVVSSLVTEEIPSRGIGNERRDDERRGERVFVQSCV